MQHFFTAVRNLIWDPALSIFLVGIGIFLTFFLRGLQFLKLPKAFKLITAEDDEASGEISSFGALATALAATIGTGNIVGVAIAITSGGPGSLFWLWVASFFGMATKYAEGILAIKFRTKGEDGTISGGPMYYILNGLGNHWKPLAVLFSIAGVLGAFFGIGTFSQVNSITTSLNNSFGFSPQIVGILIALVVALIIFGGIQSISKVAEKIVPVMAFIYLAMTVLVIIMNAKHVPSAIASVFTSAFTGQAAIGGFAGASVRAAIQSGTARSIFSNEAGLGSAPIAVAAAKTSEPVEQGLVSMTGTFITTIICTMTALAILVTDKWTALPRLEGATLTQATFTTVLGNFGGLALTICLLLFAFTTILGWSYYGERCFEFLFGRKYLVIYRLFFVGMVALGGFLSLDLIWILADIVNGLMAFPNLIALLALSPIIFNETRLYFKNHSR